MAKILAFDLDGVFLRKEASSQAHKEWFEIMSRLLRDPKVRKLAKKKDYFKEVYRLMERYTGLKKERDIDKEIMTKFARNLFQLSMLGAINRNKKRLLVKELVSFLKPLKKRYELALITTTPGGIVIPILEIIGIDELFHYVYKSPIHVEPDKKQLLQDFVKTNGKPLFYIGDSVEDMDAANSLKVPSILAEWAKYEKEAEKLAKYKVKDVKRLKELLKKEFKI